MKNNLQDTLGLTLNEARVYHALIKGISPDVSELKTETELPRTRIYEVLASLAAKGLVEKRSSSTGYRLIPPQESIPNLVSQIEKEHMQKKSTIQDFGDYLAKVWNDSLAADLSPGVELFSVEDTEPLFLEHLRNVKRRVWIAAADSTANLDMRKSGTTLASNYRDELDVRYLISSEKMAERIRTGFNHFNAYSNMDVKIRANKELHASFVLLDNIIYIFFFGGSDVLQPTTLRTTSTQLVESFSWMFERLWETGTSY